MGVFYQSYGLLFDHYLMLGLSAMSKFLKILLVVIAVIVLAICGMYLYLKHQLVTAGTEFLEGKPVVELKVGKITSVTATMSAYSAIDRSGDAERFLFDIKGEKGTIKLLSDVNIAASQFSNYIFCDEQGRQISEEDGSLLENSKRRCE